MEAIFLNAFGLSRDPFKVAPDPSFLYMSESHREALAQLEYGVKARKGFVVLTGEVGTGKTTLIHALLEELEGAAHTAFVCNTIGSPKDLLRYVCEDFGILNYRREQRELHDYLTVLNRFLLESYRKEKNVVLVIDEAQNLSAEVLESIRLLSNFETSRDKLLQIVLVGQPELRDFLDLPQLRQLKQRVAVRHHLGPLAPADCRRYVSKRLELSGGSASVVAPDAWEALSRLSGGLPRVINVLCDNAFFLAHSSGRKRVDAAMISKAAEILELERSSAEAFRPGGSEHVRRNGRMENGEQAPAEREWHLDRDGARENGSWIMPRPEEEARGFSLEGGTTVTGEFFNRMIVALADAMGPMAPVVVREQVSLLGESCQAFPRSRLAELEESVSREILNETLMLRFRRFMAGERGAS
jgi:type II secretory pathway predicted ATPase ExeA